jgi:Fic family protein
MFMNNPEWIWQSKKWPELDYQSEQLTPALQVARACQGRLLGKADAVGARELASVEQDVWTSEALATAAIEGEQLNLEAVRSSVGRRLGIRPDFVAAIPRNVEGLLDVMEDASADWNSDLTGERLFRWQAALFPAGLSSLRPVETGRYRSHPAPMQIVSGPIGKETVHYIAPASSAVPAEMAYFLDWFNRTGRDRNVDGILRAALAHLWFESIHPFEDGNGRVGRAIVDMALAQDAGAAYRVHGMSTELRKQQAAYYNALNKAQRDIGDVTSWLLWFVNAFASSCETSGVLIDEALTRARFWTAHKDVDLNERQRKVLNKMLEAGPGRFEGGMTPRKYVSLTRSKTTLTASRDLAELVELGLLQREGAGRSTYYNLAIPGWGWTKAPASGKGHGRPVSEP